MTLTSYTVKKILHKLVNGEDYRIEVVTLLDSQFLQYAIDFFKKVIDAKLRSEDIDTDWYKKEFLHEGLSTEEIAINSGLNKKTIANMYNSARREIVLSAADEHYEELSSMLETLVANDGELELTLTIKMNQVSVDLTLSESLIVINTLAVKRAAIRGGLWSTAGKRVETPLMVMLCKIYDVSEDYFHTTDQQDIGDFSRETDFYLMDSDNNEYKCEVKLMGKGNPESADAVIARDSSVFIADKLSETNKRQLDSLGVQWIELRSQNGYKKFQTVLENLNVPHVDHSDNNISNIIDSLFDE